MNHMLAIVMPRGALITLPAAIPYPNRYLINQFPRNNGRTPCTTVVHVSQVHVIQ